MTTTAEQFWEQEGSNEVHIARTAKGADPINPGHYQGMSNGAEVIDIAENMTFNGGNAIKYIARSCRMDGKVKGNVLQDLEKAAWYITREINRIKENN